MYVCIHIGIHIYTHKCVLCVCVYKRKIKNIIPNSNRRACYSGFKFCPKIQNKKKIYIYILPLSNGKMVPETLFLR